MEGQKAPADDGYVVKCRIGFIDHLYVFNNGENEQQQQLSK